MIVCGIDRQRSRFDDGSFTVQDAATVLRPLPTGAAARGARAGGTP